MYVNAQYFFNYELKTVKCRFFLNFNAHHGRYVKYVITKYVPTNPFGFVFFNAFEKNYSVQKLFLS